MDVWWDMGLVMENGSKRLLGLVASLELVTGTL
jgi:hypothetical protein